MKLVVVTLLLHFANFNDFVFGDTRIKRKAVADSDNLWPNGQILYTIADPLLKSKDELKIVQDAMKHWEENTCIQFVYKPHKELVLWQKTQQINYVEFVKSYGCYSSTGMAKEPGSQLVSIGPGCAQVEIMIHEIGHLVGLWHEQTRIDRGAHVKILWANIQDKMDYNFKRQTPMRLLTPYDFSSIMHYKMTTFSANGKKTIEPLDPSQGASIPFRQGLSFYDKLTVNLLYSCSDKCNSTVMTCAHGGFLTEDCACVCPRGLIGPTCEDIDTSNECGGKIIVNDSETITSPNYPNFYDNSQSCTWYIEGPKDTVLSLQFTDFSVEQSRYGTCRDKVEIRYKFPGLEKGPLFCGDHMNETLISETNQVFVHFRSNMFRNDKGFNLSISIEPKINCSSSPCQGNVTCEDVTAIGTYLCNCPDNWIGKNCEIPVVSGGFSEWSDWSLCFASCGIQYRTRKCDNPLPQNGGKLCSGATYETRRCHEDRTCVDSFYCDFGNTLGPNNCGITQNYTDGIEKGWYPHNGETPTLNTGPLHGHTTGNAMDMYYYLEASLIEEYEKKVFWLPEMDWEIGVYCLQFFYSMNGRNTGTLAVYRKHQDKVTSLWQFSGDHGKGWNIANVKVVLYGRKQIGIVGVRGDGYASDIAIDDISVSPGTCIKSVGPVAAAIQESPSFPGSKPPTRGCTTSHGIYHKEGEFVQYIGCEKATCFCNQNGKIDCPPWNRENVCDKMYKIRDIHGNGKPTKAPSSSRRRQTRRLFGRRMSGLRQRY